VPQELISLPAATEIAPGFEAVVTASATLALMIEASGILDRPTTPVEVVDDTAPTPIAADLIALHPSIPRREGRVHRNITERPDLWKMARRGQPTR